MVPRVGRCCARGRDENWAEFDERIWDAWQVATVAYTKGLYEIGGRLFTYLQPDGGWGKSNAGLVVGGEGSLLIDTLFDVPLTREMLETMRPITRTRPIEKGANTHGNGDHCFRNGALLKNVAIHATARETWGRSHPALLRTVLATDLGPD